MIENKKDDLVNQIHEKRQELIQIGLSKGFRHKDTIVKSQQLDQLIAEYQRQQLKNKES